MMFKRKIQEINAGSMADIAFLLLIFFLVTTTINTDEGIQRKLPSLSDIEIPQTEHSRNVLNIILNGNDELLVNNELIPIKEIKAFAMDFIDNPENEKIKPAAPADALVNLKNTRDTNYELYIQLQNELTAAYSELRNQEAMKIYTSTYRNLSREKQKLIREKYPMKMIEATIAANK